MLRSIWIWLIVYALLMAAAIGLLAAARSWTLKTLSRQEARSDWEAWRAAAQKQTGRQGPVMRRVPRTAEPPALVLMRDYYGTCVAAAVVLLSALYVTLMILVRGVLGGGSVRGRTPRL